MGLLPVGASTIAAMLFFAGSEMMLMCLAVAAGIISFWTYGIMHNFAVEAASRRSSYRGGFSDFTTDDLDEVPATVTFANMASALIGLGLFITAIVKSL